MTAEIVQLRQELQEHRDYCERRFEQGQLKFDELITCVRENTEAVTKANVAIVDLNEKTRDVVEIYNNVRGAVRIGVAVQKFGLWLTKWPLIGGALLGAYLWITEHMSK